MKALAEFVATGFYSGYLPAMPGTWGSYTAVCLTLLASFFFPAPTLSEKIITVVLIFLLGITSINLFAEKKEQDEDPGFIVIDEIAGQFLTFLFVPLTLSNLVLGFILFRLFDILKPPPIKTLENIRNPWGIMIDDLMAGGYAASLLWLMNKLFGLN